MLFVERHLLVERAADRLDDVGLDRPLQRARVDDETAVVRAGDARDPHLAGLGVDARPRRPSRRSSVRARRRRRRGRPARRARWRGAQPRGTRLPVERRTGGLQRLDVARVLEVLDAESDGVRAGVRGQLIDKRLEDEGRPRAFGIAHVRGAQRRAGGGERRDQLGIRVDVRDLVARGGIAVGTELELALVVGEAGELPGDENRRGSRAASRSRCR